MTGIIQSRRSFVRGLGALFVAAPAIVRASSLMQIRGDTLAFDEDRWGPAFIFETTADGTASWFEKHVFNQLTIIGANPKFVGAIKHRFGNA